tara:strand:- start:1721 stop:2155 length:435 start_codon:yes stop_codon:yes gene_type:complete
MKIFQVILLALFVGFTACKVAPKPIVYGVDGCHFCSMTIVDTQHATQIVTKKGRAYKFDAAECMMHYLKTIDRSEVALFLTNSYYLPGELIDATKATYLISSDIPSPMGEFLTAFDSAQSAAMAASYQGKIYTWEELQLHFEKE